MPVSRTIFDQEYGKGVGNWDEARKYMTYVEYAGDPTNNVTPEFVGQHCLNTVGSVFYIATGTAAANWAALHS